MTNTATTLQTVPAAKTLTLVEQTAETIPAPAHPALARVLAMLPVYGRVEDEAYRLFVRCPECECNGEPCYHCETGSYDQDLYLEEIEAMTDAALALVICAEWTAAEKAAHAAHDEVVTARVAVAQWRRQLTERGDDSSRSWLAHEVVALVEAERVFESLKGAK